jgi:hypothetical protein
MASRKSRSSTKVARQEEGLLSVSYRVVALSAGLVAVACVVSLIVVASLNDADALASTALALAIITFVVQLIVYVAQAEQTRRDNELSQQLHGELSSTLADLTARAHGTEQMVSTINEKVLDRALHLTGSGKFDNRVPQDFVRDLAQNLADLAQGRTGDEVGEAPATQFPRKTWGPEEDLRVMQLLTSWPETPDGLENLRTLTQDLSGESTVMLKSFADDELVNRSPESYLAPSVFAAPGPGSLSADLFARGLIESYGEGAYGQPLAHLTEIGREAARVFTAIGEPPAEIADHVTNIRTLAEEMDLVLQERFANAGTA